MKTKQWKYLACASLAGVLTLVSGCGKTNFAQQLQEASTQGAGDYQVPAKVDVLLVMDDSGSMLEGAGNAVQQQMPALISNIDSQGWDYHFATIPMTSFRTIREVLASKYDPNWVSLGAWTAPYPNATAAGISGSVVSTFFRTPQTYTDFMLTPNNSGGAGEDTFQNIEIALANQNNLATGFLRPDAALAIIVIGNGDDTTGVTFCDVAPGLTAPCELYGMPGGTMESSYQTHLATIKSFKPNHVGLVRFYSAVSGSNLPNGGCNPYGVDFKAKIGSRYIRMTQDLSQAQNVDVCQANSISTLVSNVSQNLTATRMALRTKILALPRKPNPNEKILVTKTSGGSVSVIPQDTVNGWEYIGNTTAYSIEADTPNGVVEMNQVSGYLIRLHGTAMLTGTDTAQALFQPGQ